jgi:Protein O-mannosyl-transferase TMEM260-like
LPFCIWHSAFGTPHFALSICHAIFPPVLQALSSRSSRYADRLIGSGLFLFSLALYLRTLAPSVAEVFDDSLEFQLVAARMGIAHPTGYPLFCILIKIFTFLPVGDAAYRVNLATAVFGALAIALLYAVARELINSRASAIIAALVFAFGDVYWSQAVLAEVYTLQVLLTLAMVWLALRWGTARTSLITLSFFFGLMLTHHRMSILIFPALAIYVLSYDRSFLRKPDTLLRMGIAFVLPLLLYLYIPLRGLVTSSLDGTYQNTPAGFFNWVMGSSYGVFLTQNPLAEQRGAAYFIDLFVRQFTWAGLALAVIGLVAFARHKPREWILLTLAFGANLVFGLSYRVADINVFFIPSFLFTALFVAVGVDWLAQLPANVLTNVRLHAPLSASLLILALIIPWSLLNSNFAAVDLSNKWDVHDYGLDVLSQPLPRNSTVVGILGEMTLLRYFQDTENLRPDVQTIAADTEPARMSAIARGLESGRVVFITRPLSGVDKLYSLASFGPLVQVHATPDTTIPPSPSHLLAEDFGRAKLIGYDLDPSRLSDSADWHLANGRSIRVTLYWHVETTIADDRYVSLKLLNADGMRGAQLDRRPVLDTYPTSAWRAGEFISDTYDLPILVGAAPGDYNLQVTLYDPKTGKVHGQKELTTIALPPDIYDYWAGSIDVDHLRSRDFGGILLVGYSLDVSDPYPAGAPIPVTLLWRATAANLQHDLALRLVNANDDIIRSRDFALGGAKVTPGQYLRQETDINVPKEQSQGTLTVELDNAPPDYLACELPFFTPCTVLGKVRIK